MHITKRRLQGFQHGSPQYIFLHGLLRLLGGKKLSAVKEGLGPKAAFLDAVTELAKNGLSVGATPNPASPDVRKIVGAYENAGHVHMHLHQFLAKRSFDEIHINTFSTRSTSMLPAETRRAIRKALPRDKKGYCYVVTARDGSGNVHLLG